MATTERPVESHDHDSQLLAELGYRQDLQRAWASELGGKGGGWFTGWSNLDEAAGVAET
jgi:hypothetical protein